MRAEEGAELNRYTRTATARFGLELAGSSDPGFAARVRFPRRSVSSGRSATGTRMKPRLLIFISVLLVGCGQSQRSDVPTPNAHTTIQGSRSIESFRFVGSETTMLQVTSKLGNPDRDVGSGLHIYSYRLGDGSDVLIGSADGSRILYVRHGSKVLFER
jgi:hypothetical protein